MDYKDDFYYKLLLWVLKAYKYAGISFVIIAFSVLIVNFSPNIWYTVDAGAVNTDTDTLLQGTDSNSVLSRVKELPYTGSGDNGSGYTIARKLPDKEPSLPKEPTLIIRKIGVNAKINRGNDGEKELDKGVWMPPEFKSPITNNQEPIMLLAHRFGYATWSNEFRKTNSFYNLPKLEAGDEIIIVWEQRPFKFRVEEKYNAKGTISIDHDLVMYTCKFFNSKERIVVTASRIN